VHGKGISGQGYLTLQVVPDNKGGGMWPQPSLFQRFLVLQCKKETDFKQVEEPNFDTGIFNPYSLNVTTS